MAGQTMKNEVEKVIDEIMTHVNEGDSFLLSGGAGSGKTYTLTKILEKIIEKKPHAGIACITYTNTAAEQIQKRISHRNLRVSTIHDFLWDIIQQFQKELQEVILERINDTDDKRFKLPDEVVTTGDIPFSFSDKIQYKEIKVLRKGIISHDEVIILAESMFSRYPKLCNIIIDRYQFIFIDEYQDTQVEVINIFLEHLKKSSKKNIIGFFGDSMQSIYERGIGNLNKYLKQKVVYEVKLEQNRRNPETVIELANKLRTDDITQKHSDQMDATTKNVKVGSAIFLYSVEPSLDKVRNYLSGSLKWEIWDAVKTKELNLTHNLIANQANFSGLMGLYDNNPILKYAKKITDSKIDSYDGKTFGEVLENLNTNLKENEKIFPTKKFNEYIEKHPVAFEEAKQYDLASLSEIYANKDHLLDDKKQTPEIESKKNSKRDSLIKHLFKIQDIISLYKNKQFNQFLKRTDFEISKSTDKRKLQDNIEQILNIESGKTIGETIELADSLNLCQKGDELQHFIKNNRWFYDQIVKLPYSQFLSLYHYLEGHTPFSTQHKIKGDEFENVLIIADNGKWFMYNFHKLFTHYSANKTFKESNHAVIDRTLKLLYVCCTRSKKNLAIFFKSPNEGVLAGAKELFGSDNVVNLDDENKTNKG